jgi:hypothetical protein
MVDPSSRDHRDSIRAGDAGLGEEPSHQVAHDSSNGVGCKDLTSIRIVKHRVDARKRRTHIEGIVILEDELELSGKITNGPGHDAKSDGSGYKGVDIWMSGCYEKKNPWIGKEDQTYESRRNRMRG